MSALGRGQCTAVEHGLMGFRQGVGPGLPPGVTGAYSLSLQSQGHCPETRGWPFGVGSALPRAVPSWLSFQLCLRPESGDVGRSPWPTTRVDGDGSVSLTEILLAPGSLETVQAAPASPWRAPCPSPLSLRKLGGGEVRAQACDARAAVGGIPGLSQGPGSLLVGH